MIKTEVIFSSGCIQKWTEKRWPCLSTSSDYLMKMPENISARPSTLEIWKCLLQFPFLFFVSWEFIIFWRNLLTLVSEETKPGKLLWKTWRQKLQVIVFQLESRGSTHRWRSSLRLTRILNWDAKFKPILPPTLTGSRNLWSYLAVSFTLLFSPTSEFTSSLYGGSPFLSSPFYLAG